MTASVVDAEAGNLPLVVVVAPVPPPLHGAAATTEGIVQFLRPYADLHIANMSPGSARGFARHRARRPCCCLDARVAAPAALRGAGYGRHAHALPDAPRDARQRAEAVPMVGLAVTKCSEKRDPSLKSSQVKSSQVKLEIRV